jgi:hypothetical protein
MASAITRTGPHKTVVLPKGGVWVIANYKISDGRVNGGPGAVIVSRERMVYGPAAHNAPARFSG